MSEPTIRYASVCSGVEAASLAWEKLDWKPVWFSEVEPCPFCGGDPERHISEDNYFWLICHNWECRAERREMDSSRDLPTVPMKGAAMSEPKYWPPECPRKILFPALNQSIAETKRHHAPPRLQKRFPAICKQRVKA